MRYMKSTSLLLGFLIAIGVACVAIPTACSSGEPSLPSTQNASKESAMNQQKSQGAASSTVGERQEVHGQALYGAGVLRPQGPEELIAIGMEVPKMLPSLVVFAMEHPDVPPPLLVLQEVDGYPALILSWQECDPFAYGGIFEVAPITYAWAVEGPAPRLLAITTVPCGEVSNVCLAEPGGPEIAGQQMSLDATQGPGVCLDPAYITRGADTFFEQYGLPKPEELTDPLTLAGIQPTASGRSGRFLGAVPLKDGGLRVRLAVPVDPGLPVWGPRATDRVDVFVMTNPGGKWEWFLELE
jgi:hypothetical protein